MVQQRKYSAYKTQWEAMLEDLCARGFGACEAVVCGIPEDWIAKLCGFGEIGSLIKQVLASI
ncbi:MAG: hypothetical protein M2R45_02816 [Verrucomicrobia subdivision 3 bacterium]|nr:hypothetical protein [Limisphaerales bacterium]MCS1415481.1 hypothetical protein [Limisphaerales bacterium]